MRGHRAASALLLTALACSACTAAGQSAVHAGRARTVASTEEAAPTVATVPAAPTVPTPPTPAVGGELYADPRGEFTMQIGPEWEAGEAVRDIPLWFIAPDGGGGGASVN